MSTYILRAFGGVIVLNPTTIPPTVLKASFSTKTKLTSTFSTQNKLKASFSEAAVILPNSTTQSSATVTDVNGNPQTTLTPSCTVFFPDGTSTAYTPTNAGAGIYTLTYTTKGPGMHKELWSFTDGVNTLTDFNSIPCTY